MTELTRREFLGAVGAGAVLLCAGCGDRGSDSGVVSFGVMTDQHYGDLPDAPATPRYFRAGVAKVAEAVPEWNAQNVSFVVSCGDVVQQTTDDDVSKSRLWASQMYAEFAKFQGPVYLAMGNHDVMEQSKEEFLARSCSAIKEKFYHWDVGRYRFIMLDGDYESDILEYNLKNFDWKKSWITSFEMSWLTETLREAQTLGMEAIVFCHQNFQGTSNYDVQNHAAVREVLEKSGIVRAAFGGHRHVFNTVTTTKINGIYYVGLNVVVNQVDNAYGIVTLSPDGITVKGYGVQRNEALPR